MARRYLIDSNVIIDYCNGNLSGNGKNFLENIQLEISIITNMEIFAGKNILDQEYQSLQRFVAATMVHAVNVDLISATIDIRQRHRLKLPDAIIAATAIVHNLTLLSRNTADFKNVTGLKTFDLHTI